MSKGERAQVGGGTEGEGEADSPVLREPAGGSIQGPQPKADTQTTEPPTSPSLMYFLMDLYNSLLKS